MKWLFIALITVFFYVNCNNKSNEPIVAKIQKPLEEMAEKWHHYLSRFQRWDSTEQQLNLTTLRYELQGLQYEIEIIFIPPNDSLNWVAGQYVASTFFDLSWNELPAYLNAVNSQDTLMANMLKSKMAQKEKRAIDYYLKNIKPANKYNLDYWKKHIKVYH
jgi:hypothetical protein